MKENIIIGGEQLDKKPFKVLLGGISSLIIAMGVGRFAYTPILPLMQEDLSFNDAVAGYLASSNYAGYFIGAMLVGILPLQKYRIFFLRGNLLLSVMTTYMMGISHSYTFMFIIRFISGISSAFIFVLASSIVLDTFSNKGKTNWAGYFYSGVGLGIFLSTLFIPRLNNVYNWEYAWKGLAVGSGMLTVFVWLWLKESSRSKGKESTQILPVQSPPSKWVRRFIIAYGLEGLGYIVTGTFIVSIAERTAVLHAHSSFVWMIVGLGAIPSCIIWAMLAKRWGFVRSLVIAMSLQAIGIALPVFWLSQSSLMISAFIFGGTFMGITTLATTLARQARPSNSSRIIGYLTAMYAAGQMIGPTISGILLSYSETFHVALIGAALIVFIGAILLVSNIRFE